MKIGCPAVRFVTEVTLTLVAPTAVAAAAVVCPAAAVLLPIWSAVPPIMPTTGVARIVALVVAGYGFSSMFESCTPPTLKPGMPRFQNADASSSEDSMSASGAVPAGCTGESCACSAAV